MQQQASARRSISFWVARHTQYNRGTESICSSSKATQQILHFIGTVALEMHTQERPWLIQLSLAPLVKPKPAQILPLLPAAQRQDSLLMFLLPRAAFHYRTLDSLSQLAYLALHHLDFLIKAHVEDFLFQGITKSWTSANWKYLKLQDLWETQSSDNYKLSDLWERLTCLRLCIPPPKF